MKLPRRAGATSQIFQVFIQDSSSTTGAGLTGLVFNSSSLTAYYHRDTDTTATAITLVTMTVGTFTSSGFKEIDATNMPGWYQFCPPNAALASGAASVGFHLKGATNMAPLPIEVDLDSQVDVYLWNGTAVSSPATAGIPDVNVKNMNNVAATSITTINANMGTTQPINFTSTAGNALVKSDMVDVAGAAVSTSTAQIGVNLVNIAGAAVDTTKAQVGANVVNIAGTASKGTAGYVGIDWAQISAPTTTVDLSGTTIKNLDTVPPTAAAIATAVWQDSTAGDFTTASSIGKSLYTSGVVPGAAGGLFIAGTNAATTVNFTGNMSGSVGSVTGAVGSVTGAVGSVTGNVGGNIVGSVASVTAAVTVGTINAAASNIKKNTAIDISFPMTDSTTHVLATGLTVTATRSIDGAAFASCANAVTEISGGVYNIALAAADTNGNSIMYKFTATGADDRLLEIITQP